MVKLNNFMVTPQEYNHNNTLRPTPTPDFIVIQDDSAECFLQEQEKKHIYSRKNDAFNSLDELSSFLMPPLNSGYRRVGDVTQSQSVFDIKDSG